MDGMTGVQRVFISLAVLGFLALIIGAVALANL